MLAYDVDVQHGGTAPGFGRYGERGHALALGREGRDSCLAVPRTRRAVVGAQARHERQQSALRTAADLQWAATCSAQQVTNECYGLINNASHLQPSATKSRLGLWLW